MLGGVTAPSAPEFHRRTSTYTRPPGTSHATQLDPRSSLPSRFEDENVTQIAGGLVGRPPARQLVSRKRGTLTPPAEGRSGCCIPLRRATAFYARHGITVERVITDNGSPYVSAAHAIACRLLGIRHLRTRPYRPQTNGKAERFIRTMLAGWAYSAIYASSTERTAALDGWLWHYNHHRKHSALGRQPPITRLNNLLGSYS
jgi:transposase InsO family protein